MRDRILQFVGLALTPVATIFFVIGAAYGLTCVWLVAGREWSIEFCSDVGKAFLKKKGGGREM